MKSIAIWNMLPADIVATGSTSMCQTLVTIKGRGHVGAGFYSAENSRRIEAYFEKHLKKR